MEGLADTTSRIGRIEPLNLLLATIKGTLIFVAFANFCQIFRTVLGVAKCTGLASFLRISRLRVVEF
jgi:hypothetical protein